MVVKGAELEPDLWRLKSRFLFEGCGIRDQCRSFGELCAPSPSSLEGLSTGLAFGLLDGHSCAASDAAWAYVQKAL